MNIQYVNKDITTVEHGIIVHGVNCMGVMGSGVALAIRKKWPVVYQKYKKFYDLSKVNGIMPESLLGTVQKISVNDIGLSVVNAFTQVNFGSKGKYAREWAIERCLDIIAHDHDEIHMPKIGCGLGGLSWKNISFLVDNIAETHNTAFIIYDIDK